MKTEEEIRDKIKYWEKMAKYWYKQNKDPNRCTSRGQCVFNRNMCLKEIKTLQWVLNEIEVNE